MDVHVHVNGMIARAASLLLLLAPITPAAQLSGPVVTTLTIFAGTESGLWRSTDWGYRWERVLGASGGESLREVGRSEEHTSELQSQ